MRSAGNKWTVRVLCPRMQIVLVSVLLATVGMIYLQAQERSGPRKYALVVGVKEYRAQQPLPTLSYTENDAEQLAAVLKAAGFQVTLMTQETGKEKTRFLPMSEYILDELKALVERPFLKKDDVVLVALAGHGVQFEEEKDGKKSEKFYFCPMDADIGTKGDKQNNLIPLDLLYEQLDRCEAGTRLLMVDACRNDPSRPSGLRSLNSVTRPKLAPPPGGTIAFFSCSANQRAYEDSDLKHGVFFHHMIEGLKGKADGSKDGSVTATELSEYVASETYDFVLNKYGAQQTPEMKGQIRGKVTLAKLAASTDSTSQTPATTSQSGTSLSNFVSGLLNVRQSARQRSANNLHQLGIAVHSYEQVHARLPLGTMQQNNAKVEDRFSWMCAMLPYVDETSFRNEIDFDGSRDSVKNRTHLERFVPIFTNPGVTLKPEPGQPGRADYVGWAGVGKDAPLESAPNDKKGIFGYDRATKLAEITDGTSNTVMISEASKPGAWGHGGTSTIRALTAKPYMDGVDGIGGPFKEGVHLLFADASVKMVSRNIDPSLLEKLAKRADGYAVHELERFVVSVDKLTIPMAEPAKAKLPTPSTQLNSIGLALLEHEQTYDRFPEGTRRQSASKVEDRLSWMVDLLPYLEQDQVHKQIRLDSGWTSEANRSITGQTVSSFVIPGTGRSEDPSDLGRSDYVGWAGVGANASLESCPEKKKGVFGYERVTRASDIRDGLTSTVMVSEASKPGRWAQGGASTIRGLTQRPYIDGIDGIGSARKEEFHALFGDGHVAKFSKNIDPDLLEKLATRAGQDPFNHEDLERHDVSAEKRDMPMALAVTQGNSAVKAKPGLELVQGDYEYQLSDGPTVEGDRAGRGRVRALKSKSASWDQNFETTGRALALIGSLQQQLVVAIFEKKLVCFDAVTGRKIWEVDTAKSIVRFEQSQDRSRVQLEFVGDTCTVELSNGRMTF